MKRKRYGGLGVEPVHGLAQVAEPNLRQGRMLARALEVRLADETRAHQGSAPKVLNLPGHVVGGVVPARKQKRCQNTVYGA